MNWTPSHSGISFLWCLLEEAGKLLPVKDSVIVNTQFHLLDEAGSGVYFPEWNGNKTEIAVVAYLDCFHELASITFILFIRSNRLPDASA